MPTRSKGQAPHADADARREPDPRRVNIPEGLHRERKPAYGPARGRHSESEESENRERGPDRTSGEK